MIKKSTSTLLGAALCALPIFATAATVKVSNHTPSTLVFKVNQTCSTNADGFGILVSNSSRIISYNTLLQECNRDPLHCIVKVYENSACQGDEMAEFGINVNLGVTYATGSKNNSNINIVFNRTSIKFQSARS